MTIEKFLLKENNNLDFLRIICASMVVIGHSYILNPPGGQQDVVEALTGFTYSGALAVKIFFFISGMLVTESLLRKQSVVSFSISRIFRMVPGLVFVLLLSAFIIGPIISDLDIKQYFKNWDTYGYVIKNMFFMSNYLLPGVFLKNYHKEIVNGSLWSLRYEARCYFVLLCVFIVCKYGLRNSKNRYIYCAGILLIFADAIFKLNIIVNNNINSEFRFVPMSFALGSLLSLYKEYIKIDYRVIAVLAILTLIFWRSNINEFLFTVTVCLSVIVFSGNYYIRKIKINHDISYGVYLWGFLVQQTIFHIMGVQNVYLFMMYSLVVTFIMGYLSFVLVEKRFMLYGKKLADKFRT